MTIFSWVQSLKTSTYCKYQLKYYKCISLSSQPATNLKLDDSPSVKILPKTCVTFTLQKRDFIELIKKWTFPLQFEPYITQLCIPLYTSGKIQNTNRKPEWISKVKYLNHAEHKRDIALSDGRSCGMYPLKTANEIK